jgi:hypothetical protein
MCHHQARALIESRSAKITKTFTMPLSAALLIMQTNGLYAGQQMDGVSLILSSREPPQIVGSARLWWGAT